MGKSILEEKSFQFALTIIGTYKKLCEQGEYVMSKQLLRCGTSIGANIAEATRAQSLADFSAKMYISLKEASETKYWLSLLKASQYLQEESASLLSDCDELIRMLIATTKKASPRTF
ncbi:MAG: four helix bundle protein [Bacteroidales bacterium]|nr:four helix bundle protein [Bacteroidales bacterium]